MRPAGARSATSGAPSRKGLSRGHGDRKAPLDARLVPLAVADGDRELSIGNAGERRLELHPPSVAVQRLEARGEVRALRHAVAVEIGRDVKTRRVDPRVIVVHAEDD